MLCPKRLCERQTARLALDIHLNSIGFDLFLSKGACDRECGEANITQ
jgi:hypothetical protein